MTEHDKAVDDRLQEETNFDRGVIEIIDILVEHLIDRGAVDRAYLCRALETHIAVWTASTADRPNGRKIPTAPSHCRYWQHSSRQRWRPRMTRCTDGNSQI